MFEKIEIREMAGNPVEMIGFQGMLISAGGRESFNCMTASWGGLGYMWNEPAAFVFVRPNRHTFKFMESASMFTISFFGGECKKALSICGSKSGRDTDKIAESGLSPWFTPEGNPGYVEAKYILECRKAYSQMLSAGSFLEVDALKQWYGEGNPLHKMYVGLVDSVYKRLS